MMHASFWVALALVLLWLANATFNLVFKEGQPVYILIQIGSLSNLALWKFLWHYSKINMPKCLVYYLTVHGTIIALLYWDMLGPFNCPKELKYNFNEHLLLNFVISTVICVNSHLISAVMCLVFLVLSFVGLLGQCKYPFPGVHELIEANGSEIYIQQAMIKRITFALFIFASHYVQRLILSGLYIEREMINQQKGQLRAYFTSQEQGILVLRKSGGLELP